MVTRDWRFWILVCFIGVIMAVTVRLIAETTSGHVKDIEYVMGKIDAMDSRMTKLETSTHPATTKRYTSDMAAADKALYLAEIARLDARMAEHLKHESAERAAHDWKCRQRWDAVGRMQQDIQNLKDRIAP